MATPHEDGVRTHALWSAASLHNAFAYSILTYGYMDETKKFHQLCFTNIKNVRPFIYGFFYYENGVSQLRRKNPTEWIERPCLGSEWVDWMSYPEK